MQRIHNLNVMRTGLFISLFLFLVLSGFSQDEKVLVIPKNLFVPKIHNLDTTKKDGKVFPGQLRQPAQSPLGTYSHSTPSGRVFLLSPSNMPCLVPNMNSLATMPGSDKKGTPPYMPNPFYRKRD